MDNFKHGKSLWRHNNSLLRDPEYLQTIRSKSFDIKTQYSMPIYNLENLEYIPDDEIQFSINDQLFLETLLMEIRGKSISYSSYKKKTINSAEQELIKKIQEEEDNLEEGSVPKLEQMKQQLKEIRENKMQGILIRSRANIIENGESQQSFFCNLETNNYTSKTINVLEQENGVLITNKEEILKETAKYYENLYASKDHNLWDIDLDTHMPNTTIPKLEQQEANNRPLSHYRI